MSRKILFTGTLLLTTVAALPLVSITMEPASSQTTISREELRKNKDFGFWYIPLRDRAKFYRLSPEQQTKIRKQHEVQKALEKQRRLDAIQKANTEGITGKGYSIKKVHNSLRRRNFESHEAWYRRIDPIIVSGKYMTPTDYRAWRRTLSQEDNNAYDVITKRNNRRNLDSAQRALPHVIKGVIKDSINSR